MKIEQLIVQHLYQNKSLSLQGIGIITLNPTVIIPTDSEKDFVMPDNAFSFDYNLKAPQDDVLIDFVVEKTRKIKPLATADLESYAILAKQFLNIGKPLVMDGVGTIQKKQDGNYEFIQGYFISQKIDDIPRQLKEKNEDNISFESESSKTNNSKKYLLLAFIVIIVAMSGLGLYYFLFNKKQPVTELIQQPVPVNTDSIKIDSIAKLATDSLAKLNAATVIKTDSSNFKIVIKDYNKEDAINKAFAKLSLYGHKLQIIKIDSANYKLVMPFYTSIADTLRAKDSLKKFFGGNPYLLKQ